MRYIIFGTGKYCLKYSEYISTDRILCYVDNDESKIGCELNGKVICPVKVLLEKDYDYVIILVHDYAAVVEQLLQLSIPKGKIISYSNLYDIEPIPQKLVTKNKESSIPQWTEARAGKKVFICSNDFKRRGVPVALMNLAILLKDMGYHVLLAAVRSGNLEEELCENGIDYISDIQDLYASKRFLEQLSQFNLIILGTMVLANVGMHFLSLNKPILWWIHETDEIFYKNYILPIKYRNIHYYGVGKRIIQKFHKAYPEESIKELLYCLPDIQIHPHDYSEERIFALIGNFCYRKAQDILISAIKDLPGNVMKKCIFYFVGVSKDEDRVMIENLCRKFPQVRYIYELNQKDMAEFYQKIDVLVCPSRDDPMPIVVTQGLQNGIPCIISSEVGQCEYITANGGGVVFPSEDATTLKEEIEKLALCSIEELEEKSKKARKIFDMYFLEEIMKRNLDRILHELLLD